MPRRKTLKAAGKKAPRTQRKPAGAKSGRVKIVKDTSIGGSGNKTRRQAGAIVIFAVALLFAFIVFIPGINVWRFVHRMFFGLFGPCAFIWPAILIYVAVLAAMDRPSSSLSPKLWESAGLVALVCAAVHIFTVGNFPGYRELYEKGIDLSGGGVTGGIFGAPLFLLFGKTGAAITIFLLIFVFLLLITGTTLLQMLSLFIPALRRRPPRSGAKDEPEPVFFPHDKPKFDIDVDLGPENAEMPVRPAPPEKPETADAKKGRPRRDGRKPEAPSLDALVSRAASAEQEKTKPAAAEPSFANEKSEQQELYRYPPATLLCQGPPALNEDISDELKQNAARLVDTLRSFGVETRIIDISRGPAVTRYELQPSAGVKISRITSLSDDIALNLAAAGVRIEAPIPNKAAVGIEVPNKVVSMVHIREIIESREFREGQSSLTVALGRDIAGNIATADIGKMPHVLIAGATGSGKSVCINSIIISLLYKSSPQDVRFLMVDPKVVELGVYNGIPHLLVPVVTDPRKAAGALNWAVAEMLNRYKMFADNNVRDIRGFNELARRGGGLTPMPQIVIIIDELADLMMAAPNDVEDAICRLAQMARAAGMHLVIATQRPSVDVITGVIKANIPSRIAFAVSSQVDSRTILDMGGAEKLLGRGDMLFMPVGAPKPVRVQGCFVSDKEVESVIEFIKTSFTPEYNEEIMDEIEKQAAKEKGRGKSGGEDEENGDDDADAMLSQAIECVVDAGMASTSLLQRKLKLGYARAARIIDQMEQRGIVGPFEGSKPRQVLITRQQFLEMSLNGNGGK